MLKYYEARKKYFDWKYFEKNIRKSTGLQLVVLNNSTRNEFKRRNTYSMFCEMRCFRYANPKCRHYRHHHVFSRCTWNAHKCAEASWWKTWWKTTRAMTKNTNDEHNSGHVSLYRFVVNSRVSSFADFATARKVSRTSTKWVPQDRSMLNIKRFFLLRSSIHQFASKLFSTPWKAITKFVTSFEIKRRPARQNSIL